MLCRNVHVRTRWYLTTQVVTTEVITARGNGDDALSSLRSTIQCRGRDANPLRSALQVPRNTSRRDIRIETANTNVSLMHCAVWIRNRRQASRRVASPRRDEAPAQKFPRIQDVRARTRARVCVCVCMCFRLSTAIYREYVCTSHGVQDLHSRAVTASRSLFPRYAHGLLSQFFAAPMEYLKSI